MRTKWPRLSFPTYFSKKIALSKDNKNNLSKVIVFIARLSVALGIIVSLITISTGLGSKKAIREHVADFNGHITIKTQQSNSSYNSSVLSRDGLQLKQIEKNPDVAGVQSFVSVYGIFRTEKDFAGIVFKGIGKDFDHERFKKFLLKGRTPVVTEIGFNNGVCISQKIANDLHLDLKDSIVAIFSKTDQKPLYRKFEVVGIYKTDIKMIDDQFVIGGINHARKILGMERNEVGGFEIFLHNLDDIDRVFPEIEKQIGIKNFAEKVTDQFPTIRDWIGLFDTNIAVIIILMLIVVVINIIMLLLILIIERTNSIGLLKTLGANNQQIRAIFINYTVFIMIPGLIWGNLIGVGLLLVQHFYGIIRLDPENYYISTVPVDLNPLYIVAISVGMVIISALSLIVPSYLISRISPVRSLKLN